MYLPILKKNFATADTVSEIKNVFSPFCRHSLNLRLCFAHPTLNLNSGTVDADYFKVDIDHFKVDTDHFHMDMAMQSSFWNGLLSVVIGKWLMCQYSLGKIF